MKVIICGGRDFTNHDYAYKALDEAHSIVPITHVIEGGARGADRLGRSWAISRHIPYTTVDAQWDRYGKRAGYLRNVAMADLKPDAVFALPGGVGTKMMIDIARSRNIEVFEL